MRWLGTPEELRVPRRLEQFMRLHSLDMAVIATAERAPDFERRVMAAARDWAAHRFADVIHSAYLRAIDRTLPTAEQLRWQEAFERYARGDDAES